MIGISIYSDAIRAVRLSKSKKEYKLKDALSIPLYEGDIVQGKLINKKSFVEALLELKNKMKISDSEEIYVGIPNGTAKIDSLIVENDVFSEESIINSIQFMGNKELFKINIPFISGAYRVKNNENSNENSNEKTNVINKSLKNVSYCAVPKKIIQNYASAFLEAKLNIVTLENNAIAEVRYLRHDANQPFLIIDIEYDYASFIIFSEKYGMFVLNATDCGINKLINYEEDSDGNIIESNVNHRTLLNISHMAKLAEQYYVDANLIQYDIVNSSANDKLLKQIIFLNNDFPFIIDEVVNEFSNVDILSSANMLPRGFVSKKNFENVSNYYIPMVLVMNNKSRKIDIDDFNMEVALNFIPDECVENSIYNNFKRKTLATLIGLTTLSSIYLIGTVGMNIKDVYVNKDAEKVTPELKSKYEDAKKQDQNMKDNIVKYNTIASNKHIVSPLIDDITSSKPENVYFTNINMNYKNKRIIIECFTDDKMSADNYLQRLKQNKKFANAQILTSQTKNNKTAFQINIPLENNNTHDS